MSEGSTRPDTRSPPAEARRDVTGGESSCRSGPSCGVVTGCPRPEDLSPALQLRRVNLVLDVLQDSFRTGPSVRARHGRLLAPSAQAGHVAWARRGGYALKARNLGGSILGPFIFHANKSRHSEHDNGAAAHFVHVTYYLLGFCPAVADPKLRCAGRGVFGIPEATGVTQRRPPTPGTPLSHTPTLTRRKRNAAHLGANGALPEVSLRLKGPVRCRVVVSDLSHVRAGSDSAIS